MVKKRQTDVHENGSSTDSGDEENHHHQAGGATNLSTGSASACQHIKKSVDATKLRRQLKLTGLLYECLQCQKIKFGGHSTTDPSASFEYDNTLWLCLKCGTQLCGRARNQHALQHYQTPHSDSHSLAMNTRSFVIWCYECDNEVSSNSRKNLLECVELVKRLAQKPPTGLTNASIAAPTSPSESPPPPTTITNIESKIKTALKQIGPMVPMTGGQQQQKQQHQVAIPLPPPPPAVVPGMAKRVGVGAAEAGTAGSKRGDVIITKVGGAVELDRLPSVRGLTNLGNTCFFNAVMQCLAQTPFLLSVLKELSEPGEEFVLPGGSFSFKDKGNIELPMIRGTLSSWGGLTAALANALEELQGRGGVFTPSKLFDKLCSKCPQFTGGDQHDAHELLRQLLESVRNEDLKRYQRVILQNLGYKDQDINSVSEEMRQKCKIYGNQAGDRILRPEQVFRGFLVSTLTCQDCFNISSRHEYFLDMSLPVAVEKPQPPQRRKPSPENNGCSMTTSSTNTSNLSPNQYQINAKFNTVSNGGGGIYQADDGDDDAKQPFFLHTKNEGEQLGQPHGPTKSQLKKEKERERKANRAAKHQRHKQAQKLALKVNGNSNGDQATEPTAGGGDAASAAPSATTKNYDDDHELPREADTLSSSVTTSEHSDADVEDNLQEDTTTTNTATTTTTAGQAKFYTDKNGNAQRNDTPDHMDKDSLEEDENDSGIATSPAPTTIITTSNAAAPTNNGNATSSSSMSTSATSRADDESTAASLVTAGLSEKGASLIRQISIGNGTTNGISSAAADPNGIQLAAAQLEQLKLREEAAQSGGALGGSGGSCVRSKRVRTQSYSDWSTTIAPRYQCEDGECSVQSCLNNFTAVELMTGQNKVGCESCTKRLNGHDPQAKSVNTNATKQLLISSPPAVLILHLKRFQLGPRCIFRKLTRAVTYPMLLDVAAFCGSKVKNLPNIDRKQKKLLYALYGVVEHSGGMYGGHYTAFVKVRPKLMPDDKRWKFLPHGSKAELDQDDDQLKKLEELMAKEKAREMRINAMDDSDDYTNSSSNSSTCDEDGQGPGLGLNTMPSVDDDAASMGGGDMGGIGETTARTTKTTGGGAELPQDEAAHIQAPPGKWYYVSDSRVQEVSEETALKAQAYLLFYERIY